MSIKCSKLGYKDTSGLSNAEIHIETQANNT